MFEEMGLNCVPEQGGLSELRVVSSFKLAHSQVPFAWDSSDKKTTFVFVMPLQATTAVTYVGKTPMNVFDIARICGLTLIGEIPFYRLAKPCISVGR
jgi:hypothetical protein